jgi:hypothetical protein
MMHSCFSIIMNAVVVDIENKVDRVWISSHIIN